MKSLVLSLLFSGLLLAGDVKITVRADDGKHTFTLSATEAEGFANVFRKTKVEGTWGKAFEETLRRTFKQSIAPDPDTAPTATRDQATELHKLQAEASALQTKLNAAAKALEDAIKKVGEPKP